MIPYFLTTYRTLWLRGRPGGGKTSLSVYLARMLCQQNYALNIAANIPLSGLGPLTHVLDDPLELRTIENTVMILDEAYFELDMGSSSKAVKTWLGTIRHRNQYLLLPSVLELNRQTRVFTCQRFFNGMLIGLPLWIYRWDIQNGPSKDRGFWSFWQPSQVFKLYNHRPQLGSFDMGKYYVYRYQRPQSTAASAASRKRSFSW